jgi:hypothetical protein
MYTMYTMYTMCTEACGVMYRETKAAEAYNLSFAHGDPQPQGVRKADCTMLNVPSPRNRLPSKRSLQCTADICDVGLEALENKASRRGPTAGCKALPLSIQRNLLGVILALLALNILLPFITLPFIPPCYL